MKVTYTDSEKCRCCGQVLPAQPTYVCYETSIPWTTVATILYPFISIATMGSKKPALSEGMKIPAIKALRDKTNMGLKDAKDTVELYFGIIPATTQ